MLSRITRESLSDEEERSEACRTDAAHRAGADVRRRHLPARTNPSGTGACVRRLCGEAHRRNAGRRLTIVRLYFPRSRENAAEAAHRHDLKTSP